MTIVCFGGMRDYLPDDAVENKAQLDLAAPADVGSAIDALGAPRRSLFAALVDGERATLRTPLHDGVELVLMPPFSGGARSAVDVTVSDGVASGHREDHSGKAVSKLLRQRSSRRGANHRARPSRTE